MFVQNPIKETYDVIQVKYKGYCVLVVDCDKDAVNFGAGKVIAYSKDLATLTAETMELLDNDDTLGIFCYSTFTDFRKYHSPIQVVEV